MVQADLEDPQDGDPQQHEDEDDGEEGDHCRLPAGDGDRYEAGESPERPQDGATRSTGSSAVSRLAIEGPGRLRFWPHGWRGPQSPLDPPDGSAHEGADASQAGVVGELAAQLGVGGVELDYSLELDVAQGNGGHANRSECGPGGGQDEGGA